MDDGDAAEIVALFAPDAAFIDGGRTVRGSAALAKFFEQAGRPENRGKHLTVNIVVEPGPTRPGRCRILGWQAASPARRAASAMGVLLGAHSLGRI